MQKNASAVANVREVPGVDPSKPEANREPPIVMQYQADRLRDCWIEEKGGEFWLVIRQVNFEPDGLGGVVNKQFRLDERQIAVLKGCIDLLYATKALWEENRGNH